MGRRRPTSARDTSTSSRLSQRADEAARAVAGVRDGRERAFLVGIDYKRRKPSRIAAQAKASARPVDKAGTPEKKEEAFAFSAEESLDIDAPADLKIAELFLGGVRL